MVLIIKEILSFIWNKTSIWAKVILLIVGAPTGVAGLVMWYQTSQVEASLVSIEQRTNDKILKLEELHTLRINHIDENIAEIKRQNAMIYQHLLSNK